MRIIEVMGFGASDIRGFTGGIYFELNNFRLCFFKPLFLNTLRPKQNDRHYADDIFDCNLLTKKKTRFSLSLTDVSSLGGKIYNKSSRVQVMAWRLTCDKPLPETTMTKPAKTFSNFLSWLGAPYFSSDVSTDDFSWGDNEALVLKRYFLLLTYLPLVPRICVSELCQHWLTEIMASRVFGAKHLPEAKLTYCHNWNKLQWNLNQNTKHFSHENTFGNGGCGPFCPGMSRDQQF